MYSKCTQILTATNMLDTSSTAQEKQLSFDLRPFSALFLSLSERASERATNHNLNSAFPKMSATPLIFCRKDSQSQLHNCNQNIRRSLLRVPKSLFIPNSHPLRWMAAITALGTPSPPPALTLHREIGLCHSHPLPFFIR